jgi:predicted permease
MTVSLSAMCGLLFGLAPAFRATRLDLAPALKDSRHGPSETPSRRPSLRHGLVTIQIALSLVLLVAAGLFGRTLSQLHAIELGFARDDLLLFTVRPSAVGYRGPDLTRLYEDLRQRLSGLPGVGAVSLSVRPMPAGGGSRAPIDIVGSAPESPAPRGSVRRAALATVGPRFFETMQMPLVAGRDFTAQDVVGSPRVVVVNRRLAGLFDLDNPVGRTLTLDGDPFEIVGVVEDALAFFLKEERQAIVYFSYLQNVRAPGQMTYEIRTAGRPPDVAASVHEVVRNVDPRLAIHELKTQAAHVDQAISTEITLARLGAAFGALALAIACVGIYGTVAYNVAQRRTEIGIRMALGARPGRIVWMVLRDVLWMAVVGLAVGIPFVFAGSEYVRALLYGIQPTDPWAISLAIAGVLISALIAASVPARRAARIDPLTAIRSE